MIVTEQQRKGQQTMFVFDIPEQQYVVSVLENDKDGNFALFLGTDHDHVFWTVDVNQAVSFDNMSDAEIFAARANIDLEPVWFSNTEEAKEYFKLDLDPLAFVLVLNN
jgi:hypothetical protein